MSCNCDSRIIALYTTTSYWSLWPPKWSFSWKLMVVIRCYDRCCSPDVPRFPTGRPAVVAESHWHCVAADSPGCFLLTADLNSNSVTEHEPTFTVVSCPTNFATNTPLWSEHTVAIRIYKLSIVRSRDRGRSKTNFRLRGIVINTSLLFSYNSLDNFLAGLRRHKTSWV
jgi:hypothetical protein